MRLPIIFASVFVAYFSACASPVASSPHPTVTDIWNFSPGTWVENLAVRSNGQILVTLASAPEIYQVDPTLKQPATLVHTFPGYLACLGITELQQDVFYVITGNFSTVTITTGPGSYSVWKLDMRGYSTYGGALTPSVTKIADFPKSVFFNGVTSANQEILLIADSRASAVVTLNLANKAIGKITDPLMAGLATGEEVGVNGVKTRQGTLYFTNSDQGLFAEIPLNYAGTASTAAAKTVSSNLPSPDDFQFDPAGDTYFAGNNELRSRATVNGAVTTVSNSSLLVGSTAVEFGRLTNDLDSVYVTTNGGAGQYETHVFTTPGRVVKVSLG
ncbi:hypothetical protein BDR22DRAFT_802064 [Usnea florida]